MEQEKIGMERETSQAECHHSEQRSIKSKRYELAPLASFEDLEEFKPKITNARKNCLPVIDDYEIQPQLVEIPQPCISMPQFAAVKSTQRPEAVTLKGQGQDSGSDNITPPTPRIDISCASSSSSTISDEIPSSEKELLRYGLGLDCKEEVEDLRSSTEEIAFETSATPDEGPLESKRITIESLRRGSHPANIFSRKLSSITLSDHFFRKPSVYSLHADATSPRTGRHASFGSDTLRPKSCAPSPTPTCLSGRRSASPHLMMFETSFCGNRPTLVDCDVEVYVPKATTTSSEVQVHSSPCDTPFNTTKAQVERHSSPPPTPPPQHPSTSKSIMSSFEANWCERFVVPNQPSLEEPDDDRSSEKVCLDKDDQVNLNCTKDESTDFSDKETKFENENISDVDILNEEVQTIGIINADDVMAMPQESAGLVLEENLDEESDLPYVPTTLPLEKSVALPIVPVKDRAGYFVPMTPIQRPRSTQPPNLTSIEDYITTVNSHEVKVMTEKMKISLPKEDSVGEEPERSKTPRKEMPTTWTNFAEMGLRNPRNLRRQVKEEFK